MSKKTSIAKILLKLFFLTVMTENIALGQDYPFPEEYVRIKCLWGNQFLHHKKGETTLQQSTELKMNDLSTHWKLVRSPDYSKFWMINRLSGQALHIQNSLGVVETGPLLEDFTSYRWNIVD